MPMPVAGYGSRSEADGNSALGLMSPLMTATGMSFVGTTTISSSLSGDRKPLSAVMPTGLFSAPNWNGKQAYEAFVADFSRWHGPHRTIFHSQMEQKIGPLALAQRQMAGLCHLMGSWYLHLHQQAFLHAKLELKDSLRGLCLSQMVAACTDFTGPLSAPNSIRKWAHQPKAWPQMAPSPQSRFVIAKAEAAFASELSSQGPLEQEGPPRCNFQHTLQATVLLLLGHVGPGETARTPQGMMSNENTLVTWAVQQSWFPSMWSLTCILKHYVLESSVYEHPY